jgi:surface carbohydrate biosynthesis protein
MPDMRIGLIVDHPKRDLAGVALVAYEIAKRGGEAVVVPMYEQGVDIPRLGLDAVVVNFVRPANRMMLERYAAAGIKVFVLDTEGGVLAKEGGNSPASLARTVRNEGYAPLLAGYLFWGSELYDAFVREGAMPPDRLHVTGCPRFDLAARSWRALLVAERQGYLLVNANFPLVNPRFSGSSSRERDAMISAGWDAGYVDRLLGDLRAVFPRYLQTIRELALARPGRKVLVRPHPFENEQPYRAAIGDLPNVEVNGDGNVLEVIHNAKSILHLNCGTAIEAVMLEKLPLQLGFLNTDATAHHAELPAQVSRNVDSLTELLAATDDVEGETARFPFAETMRGHIRRYFHDVDGNASARVADIVMREAGTRRGKPWRSFGAVLTGSRRRPSKEQFVKGVASAILGSATTSQLRSRLDPRRRDKIVAPEVVRSLVSRFAAHEKSHAGALQVTRVRSALGMPLASISVRAS